MIRRIIYILILTLLLTSCGGAAATQAPAATEPPAATQAPATEAPVQPLAADTSSLDTATAVPTQISSPTGTPLPQPTLPPSITPTDTQLPPLLLPTEAVNAPATQVWDGTPTYLGDSQPGYSFRVTYNPDVWALTSDQFGFPALGHRTIPSCVISVTSGRGMPGNVTVEHDNLYADNIMFDVSTAYENGVKKFVTYTGGDGTIVTAFEVSFVEQSDTCLADAVTVLSTLRSVPNTQATPQP